MAGSRLDLYNALASKTSEAQMIVIKIPRKQWGKAWRAMIEIGPVRMIAKDPLVVVLPAHLELLGR
jgi:hypothetical protein